MSDISSILSWDEPSRAYSQSSWPKHVPIPDSFLCPLSKRLMEHPVIDREGNSYERETILSYLRQSGKGHSPVTTNPLQESDLVDNKALRIAIDAVDCALKKLHDKDQCLKSKMARRIRIRNPLSSSMKVAMLKVSTTFGQDKANSRSDLGKTGPLDDSSRTEKQRLDDSSQTDREYQHPSTAPSSSAAVLPAVLLETSIASASSGTDDRNTASHPRRDAGRHETMSSNFTRTHRPANNAKIFHQSVTENDGAVQKFEERLKKKLSEDPRTVCARDERLEKLQEKLRSKERHFRQSKLQSNSRCDIQGARAEYEKRAHHESMPPMHAEGFRGGPNNSRKEENKGSDAEDPPGARGGSTKTEASSKQDAYYTRLQEERRRVCSRKRDTSIQKHRLSPTRSLKQATASAMAAERRGTGRDGHRLGRSDRPSAKLNGCKVMSSEAAGNHSSVTDPQRSRENANEDKSTGAEILDKFEEKLRKKLSEDPAARAKYERKARQAKTRSKDPVSQEASPGDPVKQSHASLGQDVFEAQNGPRRKRRERRGKASQKSRQMRSESSKQNGRTGMSEEHRPSPLSTGKLNHDEFDMSELTFDKGVATGEYGQAILLTGSTANEQPGETHTAVKAAKRSNGILHRNLPGRPRFERRDSAISWAELDGETVRAEFLSMKATGRDAAALQAALLEAETDPEPRPSGGGRAVRPSMSKPGSWESRGSSDRQDSMETSSLDTFSGKVNALMEVVEGSDKTTLDVMKALKKAKGDIGNAAAILLQLTTNNGPARD